MANTCVWEGKEIALMLVVLKQPVTKINKLMITRKRYLFSIRLTLRVSAGASGGTGCSVGGIDKVREVATCVSWVTG